MLSILYVYILAAVAMRILPHPWNFTPMGAMFLFSGATFQRRLEGWIAPLIALMSSDYVVNLVLYQGKPAWFAPLKWAAFSAVGVIGWTLRNNISVPRVIAAATGGSITFFVFSNLSVWISGGWYPHTWAGLIACYTAALPFFTNDLTGNLVFSGVMFGSYHWLLRRREAAATAKA